MYLNEDASCCAITEIAEMQEHDSPKEAMLSFCNKVIVNNRYTGKLKSNLGGFYIFAGVERVTNPKIKTFRNGEEQGDEYYFSGDEIMYPVKIRYASEFAAFIRQYKLGDLKASPARPNTLNHPEHIVRCWIWSPNEKTLLQWYQRNNR